MTDRFGARLAAIVVGMATIGGGPTHPVARAANDLAESRQVALQRAAEGDKDKSTKSGESADRADKSAAKNAKKSGGKTPNAPAAAARTTSTKSESKASPAAAPSAEKEARVREFVARHHVELDALLEHLKDNNRGEYERAVRDLDRAVERVESWRGRDARRHELELKQWQNQSRIDLLVARLKMANSEDYREPMRALLRERYEIKSELLALERTRLAERLEKTDQQLQALEAGRDAVIESQLKVLLGANKPGKAARPAAGAKQKSSK